MKLQCQAIAAKYFAQVSQLGSAVHHERRSLTGRAFLCHEPQQQFCWVRVIEAPRPVTRRALYIFLHECAHHLLGHLTDNKPKHVHELEAERCAHETMRAEGLAVLRKESRRAKEYVALKIHRALKRGREIHRSRSSAIRGYETKSNRIKRESPAVTANELSRARFGVGHSLNTLTAAARSLAAELNKRRDLCLELDDSSFKMPAPPASMWSKNLVD